jgi:hypothetical protein
VSARPSAEPRPFASRGRARAVARLAAGLLLACPALWGCAAGYRYREPNYEGPVGPHTVAGSLDLDPALEARILALDPEHISDHDVRDTLVRGPAPRIVNLHGGIPLVYLAMSSFSRFLVGMGYPEAKIRNPRDGSYSYSPYRNSAQIAGVTAWYYEREGMSPMLIGHSMGGIQTVKVLHELAGAFADRVAVWNPLTDTAEARDWIVDPLTGAERPVVGLSLGYASAVAAGGVARLFPTMWKMTWKLRTIPGSAETFTGYYLALDLIGGDFWSLIPPANKYRPQGTATVRNVQLPPWYFHVTVPTSAHLADDPAIRDWINAYRPTDRPRLTGTFEAPYTNILWAADVWYGVKRQWCLAAQRLIRAKRALARAS